MATLEASKQGQGAFSVVVFDNGITKTQIKDYGQREFANAQEAYDFHRGRFDDTGNNSDWNICYHLEDVL